MARTSKQMQGRVEVCRGVVRSDVTFMERRLQQLGCKGAKIEGGSMRGRGKILRAFVLTVPAEEYAAVFPPLEAGTAKSSRVNSTTEEEY